MVKTLDVTGLPDSVVHDIQQLVASIRENTGLPSAGRASAGHPASAAERLALFEAWVRSHSPSAVIADDSRESIYAGRGE